MGQLPGIDSSTNLGAEFVGLLLLQELFHRDWSERRVGHLALPVGVYVVRIRVIEVFFVVSAAGVRLPSVKVSAGMSDRSCWILPHFLHRQVVCLGVYLPCFLLHFEVEFLQA